MTLQPTVLSSVRVSLGTWVSRNTSTTVPEDDESGWIDQITAEMRSVACRQ
jgi:hypothetical protein